MSKSNHNRKDDSGDSRIDDLFNKKISTAERSKEKRLQRALKTHNVDELLEEEYQQIDLQNDEDDHYSDWLEYKKQQDAAKNTSTS